MSYTKTVTKSNNVTNDNPMKQTYFTLGQASIETGKSKPTISRDIKKGKLSAEKLANGSYKIQAIELFRVYDKKESETVLKSNNVTNDNPYETSNEIEMLRQELNFKNQTISSLEKQLEKTENNCDNWRNQAERISLLLTDQTEQSPKILSWFDKLTGRA